jgi:hypothetical protein
MHSQHFMKKSPPQSPPPAKGAQAAAASRNQTRQTRKPAKPGGALVGSAQPHRPPTARVSLHCRCRARELSGSTLLCDSALLSHNNMFGRH